MVKPRIKIPTRVYKKNVVRISRLPDLNRGSSGFCLILYCYNKAQNNLQPDALATMLSRAKPFSFLKKRKSLKVTQKEKTRNNNIPLNYK